MADNTVRGRFVWHELQTPNGAGAQSFYTQTLGWKTQAWEHDPSYTMFVAPQGPLGAAVEQRGSTPQWLAYISTTDVAATVDAAQRLGGKVLTPPTTVANAGTHAVLADPQGAVFGVHASAMPPRPAASAEPGEFSWHELATTAPPEQALTFYAALFGWDELGRHDMGPLGTYLLFGQNGQQLGGMFKKGEMGKAGAGYWVGYVRVGNVDDALSKAKAARGAVLTGPMDVPGGDRVAQLMDPHGAIFAVHMLAVDAQPPAPAKAAKMPVRRKPAKTVKKKTKKTKKKASVKQAAKRVDKKKSVKKKVAKKVTVRRPAQKRAAAKKRVAAKKKPAARRSKGKRKSKPSGRR